MDRWFSIALRAPSSKSLTRYNCIMPCSRSPPPATRRGRYREWPARLFRAGGNATDDGACGGGALPTVEPQPFSNGSNCTCSMAHKATCSTPTVRGRSSCRESTLTLWNAPSAALSCGVAAPGNASLSNQQLRGDVLSGVLDLAGAAAAAEHVGNSGAIETVEQCSGQADWGSAKWRPDCSRVAGERAAPTRWNRPGDGDVVFAEAVAGLSGRRTHQKVRGAAERVYTPRLWHSLADRRQFEGKDPRTRRSNHPNSRLRRVRCWLACASAAGRSGKRRTALVEFVRSSRRTSFHVYKRGPPGVRRDRRQDATRAVGQQRI